MCYSLCRRPLYAKLDPSSDPNTEGLIIVAVIHQKLGGADKTPLEVIEEMRSGVKKMIRQGNFNRANWDHNHPEYHNEAGCSNKRVKIYGHYLLGGREDATFDEQWDAVMRALL